MPEEQIDQSTRDVIDEFYLRYKRGWNVDRPDQEALEAIHDFRRKLKEAGLNDDGIVMPALKSRIILEHDAFDTGFHTFRSGFGLGLQSSAKRDRWNEDEPDEKIDVKEVETALLNYIWLLDLLGVEDIESEIKRARTKFDKEKDSLSIFGNEMNKLRESGISIVPEVKVLLKENIKHLSVLSRISYDFIASASEYLESLTSEDRVIANKILSLMSIYSRRSRVMSANVFIAITDHIRQLPEKERDIAYQNILATMKVRGFGSDSIEDVSNHVKEGQSYVPGWCDEFDSFEQMIVHKYASDIESLKLKPIERSRVSEKWSWWGNSASKDFFNIAHAGLTTLELPNEIGFVQFGLYYHKGILFGELANVYVQKEWRNKGYGEKLMKFAENALANSGCQAIFVEIARPSLRPLVEGAGFEKNSIMSRYRKPGYIKLIDEGVRDRIFANKQGE